jgi:enamine deaminase RidA (YjgF/YER057c/UK114 family)
MASSFIPVFTTEAPAPLPQFSQAVVYNGLVYCSGNIGIKPGATIELVEGTAKDRAVSSSSHSMATAETNHIPIETSSLQYPSRLEGFREQSG